MTDIRTRGITYEQNISGTSTDSYVKVATFDLKGLSNLELYLYNADAGNTIKYKGVWYLTADGTYTTASIAEATLAPATGILIEKSSLILDRIEFWIKSNAGSHPADFTIEALVK